MTGKTQEVTGKDMEFLYGFQSHFSFIAKHNDLRFVREQFLYPYKMQLLKYVQC